MALNEAVQFGNTLLPDTFSITVSTNISVLQTAGGTQATIRDFTITYSKNRPYKRSDVFYFNNGVDVSVEITNITPYNISTTLASSLLLLSNDMRIDHSYTTNCADCWVGAFNSYTTNITDNQKVHQQRQQKHHQHHLLLQPNNINVNTYE